LNDADTLGRKPVVLTYDGSDIYVRVQVATNWSVVSPSTIIFEDASGRPIDLDLRGTEREIGKILIFFRIEFKKALAVFG